MAFRFVLKAFAIILILEFPRQSLTNLGEFFNNGFDLYTFFESTVKEKSLEKRSILTFPPQSLLQINMGIALAGHLERNSASIVLAFQQNTPLPNETQPFVVAGKKFSIYDHLQNVFTSYGLNGSECLKKMICQIGETPLVGGLVEDMITFILSPSKHRNIYCGDAEKRNFIDLLIKSERLGKSGTNCSFAFPNCVRTPLDFISTSISF